MGLLVLVLQWPGEGLAVSCRDWERLDPDQKIATVDHLISSAVSGSGGRQYHLNRAGVARCLQSKAEFIEYDFDDACADSRSSMQALNNIFKRHIWDCAG